MSVLGGWVLVPAALMLLVVGQGLLVEALSRVRLPGAILPGVGLASVIVVGTALTVDEPTSGLAVPVLTLLAVVGLVLGRHELRRLTASTWHIASAVAVYLAFAAPSLLIGDGSIAGYLKLDDPATWLAITAHLFEHGRNLDGLPPSSFRRALEQWMGSGYPVGSFVPLGAAARLARQDPAAGYQAVIGVYAAIGALGLAATARSAVRRSGAALVGAVAALASVSYGYAQWGGVKEAAATALLPTVAVLAVATIDLPLKAALVPMVAVIGGLVGTLGVNGLVWAAPAGALAVGLRIWHRQRSRSRTERLRPRMQSILVPGGATFVLSVAALVPQLATSSFLRQTTAGGAISNQDEVANLLRPLPLIAGAGLWPRADFRLNVDAGRPVIWIAMACALAALASFAITAARRQFALPSYIVISLGGAVPALAIGSPWVDAKVLAIVAPCVLAGAMVFGLLLAKEPDVFTRSVGAAFTIIIVAGALWSTTVAAANTYVAPRARFAELRAIGDRIAGEGPTLVLDFEIYASRYFLRDAAPEGATELRYRAVRRSDGTVFPDRSTVEVDDIADEDLAVYRTLVRRRSPVAGQPPSSFDMVLQTRSWEVFQRNGAAPPLARLPLGSPGAHAAAPACADVEHLAATPGATSLLAVPARAAVIVPLRPETAPPRWRLPAGISATETGPVSVNVEIEQEGRHQLWVGGAVLGRLTVSIDDQAVGSTQHDLAHAGQWMRLGEVELERGGHVVKMRYTEAPLRSRTFPLPVLGPVALTLSEDVRAERVPVSDFRSLCDGRTFDWIEAVTG